MCFLQWILRFVFFFCGGLAMLAYLAVVGTLIVAVSNPIMPFVVVGLVIGGAIFSSIFSGGKTARA